MLRGFPSPVPSSLGPSRLGIFCSLASLWFTEMAPQGRVGWPPMSFEDLLQLGYGQRFMTQFIPESALRLRGRRVSRFLQSRAPCSEEGRDRYTEDRLTDTISANIAPVPQDALPCVFLSAVAGRGRLLPTSASGARDLGKQDAAGSRLDPGARRGGGGCTIKTSNAAEEDKQTGSFQCGPGRGRVGAPGPGLAGVPAAVLADVRAAGVSIPRIVSHPGWDPGQAPGPLPAGDTGQRGRWRMAGMRSAAATGHCHGVQPGTWLLLTACLQHPFSPF